MTGQTRTSEVKMIVIRIPRKQWGKAWRAMIEVGPVRMISKEPLVEVLPAHLDLLTARGFSFERVEPARRPLKRRHAALD
jgi:hypothetical protein